VIWTLQGGRIARSADVLDAFAAIFGTCDVNRATAVRTRNPPAIQTLPGRSCGPKQLVVLGNAAQPLDVYLPNSLADEQSIQTTADLGCVSI
jgi:hypothetical protein